MPNYNSDLQAKNAKLDAILQTINSLPDAGGPAPVIQRLDVTSNGTYNAPDGVDGYSPVTVNCPVPKIEQSKEISITANGQSTYIPNPGKVWNKIVVNANIQGADISPLSDLQIRYWTPIYIQEDINVGPLNNTSFVFVFAKNVTNPWDGNLAGAYFVIQPGASVFNGGYKGAVWKTNATGKFYADTATLKSDGSSLNEFSFDRGVEYVIIKGIGRV